MDINEIIEKQQIEEENLVEQLNSDIDADELKLINEEIDKNKCNE